jgi:hypothetical protein
LFRLARWLAIWLAAGVLLLVVIAFAARWHDGPLGPFPGGAMSGELVEAPVADWSALLPANPDLSQRIELQVDSRAPRALTTSYIVRDGKLYVFALLAAHKTWPAIALADERVLVRAGGRLYPLRAVRVMDPAELAPLALQLGEIEPGATATADALPTWYFRMEPRAP